MKPDSTTSVGKFRRIVYRALTATCAIALTAGLAGCGNSTAGTVTLDFFQFKAEAADWFTAKAKEFEKTHPSIKVNVNNSSDATTDLRTRLVKNREPDVITINGDINFGMLAEAGVFHDFTDDDIVDELNPGMVNIAKSLVQTNDESKKRLYGLPYAGNASGYIINADVWEEAGEDPDNPPQTWSEFIDLLQRFKSKGIVPIEASTADPWTLQAPLASLNSTLVPESEYLSLKDGSKKFSDLWGTVSDQLVEIYQNYTQKNPAVTYQQATQDLAAGKAAILPLGTYAIPQIRLINSDANLRFAQMPATDDASEQQLTAGDDVILTMGAHTKHEKEAREFIDFLMNDENIKDYSKQQSAFTPYKDTYVGDEALNGVLDFYQAGKLADFCDHYVPASINIAGFLQTLVQSGNTEKIPEQHAIRIRQDRSQKLQVRGGTDMTTAHTANTAKKSAKTSKNKVSKYSKRKVDPAFYWMTVPAAILVSIFLYWPFLQGAAYSFTNSQGYGDFKFIGLKNYIAMFQDSRVGHAYLFTILIAVLITLGTNILGMFLVGAADSKIAFKNGFQCDFLRFPYHPARCW